METEKALKPMIVFDTETTGTDTETAHVITLYAKKYYPNKADTEVLNIRVKPPISIPKGASKVNGIFDEDVKDCEDFSFYADRILDFFHDSILVAHNVMYDAKVLEKEMSRIGKTIITMETLMICTLKIERLHHPMDLKSVYERFTGSELVNAHSAKEDTEACDIVWGFQQRNYGLTSMTPEEIHKLCWGNSIEPFNHFELNDDGEEVFAFGKHKGKLMRSQISYLKWMLNAGFPNPTKKFITNALIHHQKM